MIRAAPWEVLGKSHGVTVLEGKRRDARIAPRALTAEQLRRSVPLVALFAFPFPLSMRRANLSHLLARRVDGIFLSDFEQGEIGPDLFRHACLMGLEGLVCKHCESNYRGGRSDHWIADLVAGLASRFVLYRNLPTSHCRAYCFLAFSIAACRGLSQSFSGKSCLEVAYDPSLRLQALKIGSELQQRADQRDSHAGAFPVHPRDKAPARVAADRLLSRAGDCHR